MAEAVQGRVFFCTRNTINLHIFFMKMVYDEKQI